MTSLLILLLGAFWEASMDIIASERNYKRSIWFRLATYLDNKGYKRIGHQFWDYRVAWRNKWKDGDPTKGRRFLGSTGTFVTALDGWHLMKFFWFAHMMIAIVLYEPITPYWGLDAYLFYVMFGGAHSFTIWWMQLTPYQETEKDKQDQEKFEEEYDRS